MTTSDDSKLSRRSFFWRFCAVVFALLVRPKAAWAGKKIALPLDKLVGVQSVGGSMLIKAAGHEILLVRATERAIVALNPICTHEKCTVTFDKSAGNIQCPCHHSIYSLDGINVKGPAPRPLQVYPAEIVDNRLVIDLGEPEAKS